MKGLMFAALVCAAAVVSAAEVNLLKGTWRPYGDPQATVIKDGVGTCKVAVKGAGMTQGVVLNQKTAQSLIFSGESKAANVAGATNGNYCIYMDVLHTDGKSTYGQQIPFKVGTHDWEKVSATYKPSKPIKSISFYALFRNMKSGEVSFRNLSLTPAK